MTQKAKMAIQKIGISNGTSKNGNDKIWQKKVILFMSDFESDGLNLPTRKFLARSEVRIDETPFWCFG